MKTLRYLLVLTILLCINLTSCSPDDSVTENETLHTEVLGTDGDNEKIGEDEN
ncbi:MULTISPECIES: hypothetical protein [Aquimarina]|uniref:hypothetical protein n=1 Tax=Aquimarina TaxID=290174 RepID=UPI001304868A|nr:MULTISPECIES: hypothetical protein [Aquimarina]